VIAEVNVGGVLFSGVLLTAALAALVLLAARRALRRAGFYSFVWHPHLVDLALFLILWAAVTFAFKFSGWEV
jgi:protein-S-isoprenylcysteine O-methyltransferase Ste14